MFILHIGKHKAGSSTIQNFLACNAEKLRQFDIIYPEIGRKGQAHHGLYAQIKGRSQADLSLGGWSDIKVLGRDNPDKKIVLSSEGLETLKSSQIRSLREQLGDTSTLIVVYVRDFAGQLPSRYSQLTKRGINTRNFDEFYDKVGPTESTRLAGKFAEWAQVFGWDNLRIRSLDSRSLTGGTLIDDLLSVLGVSLADLGGSEAEGLAPVNVSNGWKTTELLRALYARASAEVSRDPLNPKRVQRDVGSTLHNLCVQVMTEIGLDAERTPYLSARQCAECDEAWAREVEELNRLIVGPKLPLPDTGREIAERPFLPSIERIPADERAEIASRLAKRFLLGNSTRAAQDDRLSRIGFGEDLRRALVRVVSEREEAMQVSVAPKGASVAPKGANVLRTWLKGFRRRA